MTWKKSKDGKSFIITPESPLPESQAGQSPEHPEDYCKKCGSKNPYWTAENNLFNEVNGSPDGIMCPNCFISMANEKDIDTMIIQRQKRNP